jgi:hypothetical protein
MEHEDSQRASASKKLTKRPYQKPQLEVYGDLAQITQTVANAGHKDTAAAQPRTH